MVIEVTGSCKDVADGNAAAGWTRVNCSLHNFDRGHSVVLIRTTAYI